MKWFLKINWNQRNRIISNGNDFFAYLWRSTSSQWEADTCKKKLEAIGDKVTFHSPGGQTVAPPLLTETVFPQSCSLYIFFRAQYVQNEY